MTHNEVVEKIKKLLSLSSSPNENEAKLAFQKAQELIGKYAIDMAGENKVENIQEITYTFKPLESSSAFRVELIWIVTTISSQFYCEAFNKYGIVTIVGYPINLEACKYALDCILNQAFIDYKEEYAKHRSIAFSSGFWRGFSLALNKKFKQKEQEEIGIVLYNKVKDYLQNSYKLRKVELFGASEFGRTEGFKTGESVQLRQGVDAGNNQKRLI